VAASRPQSEAERFARLLQQKAIAPQDADDAKAAYLEAQANAQSARLNLEYTAINRRSTARPGDHDPAGQSDHRQRGRKQRNDRRNRNHAVAITSFSR